MLKGFVALVNPVRVKTEHYSGKVSFEVYVRSVEPISKISLTEDAAEKVFKELYERSGFDPCTLGSVICDEEYYLTGSEFSVCLRFYTTLTVICNLVV